MNQQERVEYIRARITESLAPIQLDIVDDSHRHAGHASAKGGGHYNVDVVSEAFQGKTLLQRHRMVYEVMGEAMGGEIHALSIRAKTPEEAENERRPAGEP